MCVLESEVCLEFRYGDVLWMSVCPRCAAMLVEASVCTPALSDIDKLNDDTKCCAHQHYPCRGCAPVLCTPANLDIANLDDAKRN